MLFTVDVVRTEFVGSFTVVPEVTGGDDEVDDCNWGPDVKGGDEEIDDGLLDVCIEVKGGDEGGWVVVDKGMDGLESRGDEELIVFLEVTSLVVVVRRVVVGFGGGIVAGGVVGGIRRVVGGGVGGWVDVCVGGTTVFFWSKKEDGLEIAFINLNTLSLFVSFLLLISTIFIQNWTRISSTIWPDF